MPKEDPVTEGFKTITKNAISLSAKQTPKQMPEDPVTEGVKSVLNKAKGVIDSATAKAQEKSEGVPGAIMGRINKVMPQEGKNGAFDGKAPKDGEGSLDPTGPQKNIPGTSSKAPKEDPVTEGLKSIMNKAKDAISLAAKQSPKMQKE